MYYLELYNTKLNVGVGEIREEYEDIETAQEKAIEEFKKLCRADKENTEILIRDRNNEDFNISISKNTLVMSEIYQANDLGEFKKSKKYQEILKTGKVWDYENFTDYVNIRIYEKLFN